MQMNSPKYDLKKKSVLMLEKVKATMTFTKREKHLDSIKVWQIHIPVTNDEACGAWAALRSEKFLFMAESLHTCKHLRLLIVSHRTAISTQATGSFLADGSSLGQVFPMDLPSMAQAPPSMREDRKDSVSGELRLLGRGTTLLLGLSTKAWVFRPQTLPP